METIGNTTYTSERRTALVAHPRWTPPAMPCGAWLPVRPMETPPATVQLVWLVRSNGTTEFATYINGWEVAGSSDGTGANPAEFVGWRGMR